MRLHLTLAAIQSERFAVLAAAGKEEGDDEDVDYDLHGLPI